MLVLVEEGASASVDISSDEVSVGSRSVEVDTCTVDVAVSCCPADSNCREVLVAVMNSSRLSI